MAERDELLDVLGQARPDLPDELVSPHAPAAQALLEEILSMDTLSSDTMSHTTSPTRTTETRPSRRRRLVLAGAAAAAAAAVATATILTIDSGEQVEAATVHAAAAETSAALAESGRAELRYHSDYDGGEHEENGTEWFAFSGDDVSIRARPDGWPTDAVTRIVDGRTYVFPNPPDAPANANEVNAIPYRLDPERLLAALRDVSTFETIGREDVDGVPTRHLRATDPEDANAAASAFGRDGVPVGTVTTLDVWVDDDGMVRRIDISTVVPEPDDLAMSFSVRFFDFGAPITIERPAPDEPVAIGEAAG